MLGLVLIGVISSVGMRDEVIDVNDESDESLSRSKTSVVGEPVSSVVVVLAVVALAAVLSGLVLDLVSGVMIADRCRRAIKALSSSKKKWKPPTVVTL
jgi:hypothetical protein